MESTKDNVKLKRKQRFNFNLFIDKLTEYKKQYGDCYVPQKYCCVDGYKLGVVVSEIRENKVKLTMVQKEILNNMNFVWNAKVFNFEKYISKLMDYKERYGDCLVPYNYVTDDDYHLGNFTWKIRSGYIQTTLIQKNILDDLGFVWDVKLKKIDYIIEQLRKYKDEYGNLRVPIKYVCSDGLKLGIMVSYIRSGKIKPDKRQKEILDEMGFIWRVSSKTKVNDLII